MLIKFSINNFSHAAIATHIYDFNYRNFQRADKHIIYFYCNRSGKYSKKSQKHQTKLQGTAYCTAAIQVKKGDNEKIQVHICKTHYGHQPSLGHLRLHKSQREAIASQLAQGITSQHVLDKVRDSIYDKFERIHLITKKDTRNIEHLVCMEMKDTKMMLQVLAYGLQK